MKKHISAPSAAEPTQEATIVPVPTTEPASLASFSELSEDWLSVAAAAAELSVVKLSGAEVSAGSSGMTVGASFMISFSLTI